MEQEFIIGRCPQCGEELKVPTTLERFSCMYCGARLTQQELRPRQEQKPGEREDYEKALALLPGCVTRYRGWQARITRSDFTGAFDEYASACAPVIMKLDSGIRAADDRNAAIQKAAQSLLDALKESWQQEKKRKQTITQDDDKIVLAIFFVPLVRKLELPSGEAFAKALQEEWVRRYPKNPFYLGSYDDIAGGFKKRFLGLCFITTAVCEFEGKSDDCEELTSFRAFRDGWLRQQPDGEALIREYYEIAPGIVSCIDLCSDRAARYAAIREQYLTPCYRDLQAGDPASCKETYVRMVRELQKEYLS